MKIAFPMIGNIEFNGGNSYIKYLIHALKQTYGDKIKCFLLKVSAKNEVPVDLYNMIDGVVPFPLPERWTLSWIIKETLQRTFLTNVIGEHCLKKHKIDVLFGYHIPYRYGKIPTLSWIYDFQHAHFPDIFTTQECFGRNRTFSQAAKVSTRIILMSDSVKKDFQMLIPRYVYKARVIKAVSHVFPSIYKDNPMSIVNRYQLPEKFIYLPNQFWKHKNHEIVFQALKILQDNGVKVFLVCSGHPNDYRHPNYFEQLFQKVTDWNIKHEVAYLGMIPHRDVLLLMRQSICVLNPSLFEGFGLTVDEARSVGKQVLLSDIAAHREQNPPKATFFNPYNAEEVAEAIAKIWNGTLPGPDIELERKAREELPERIKDSAHSFMSVIKEVIK